MSTGDRISVCVVGGGIAGSLLAWRLASEPDVARVDLLLGAAFRGLQDATATSAGVVRGFDPDVRVSYLATESLIELYSDPRLRRWAEYEEVGSLYIRTAEPPSPQLSHLERTLPGSADLVGARRLRGRGWGGLPETVTGVFEWRAGRISPSALRSELLHELFRCRCADVLTASLAKLTVSDAGSVRCDLLGASSREYDVVVIAAGRWTGVLLQASGLEPTDLQTKSIECSVWETRGWRPPAFVDETSGLYGTPLGRDQMLLGVPVEHWNVDPDWPPENPESRNEVTSWAARRLPSIRLGDLKRRVISADCYGPARTLSLDPVADTRGCVHTFAGGSGGSIKTALAASRRAAAQMTGSVIEPATWLDQLRTPEGTIS
jgi:glycine/D-amino acid oxidase-like deaminating enzyme